MTAMREEAFELLEKMPEDKLVFIIQIMQGVNSLFAAVSRGPRRCQRATANGHAHSARAGKARSCGTGGLQETASSESARGMGCFGHLSSF